MSELKLVSLGSRRHFGGCASLVLLVWFAQGASMGQDLRERVLGAKADFQPIDGGQVGRAETRVVNALNTIKQDMMMDPSIAAGWQTYLMWDEQERQLPQRPVDLAFWRKMYHKVASNEDGLERPWFKEYRQALRELIDTAEAAAHADLQAEFEQTLDAISKLLPHDKGPQGWELSSEEAEQLTQLLTLLQRRRQVEPLVQVIRNRYSQPNIVAFVSAALIQEAVSRELDEEFEIRSNVRGASVQGTGRLRASQKARLPEDAEEGALRIVLSGTSVSDTTSYQDRVSVRCHGVLTFDSTSSIRFGPRGIDVEPFRTACRLDSQIEGISTPYAGLRRSRARNTVYSRQRADRQAAERQANDELSATFTRELREFIEPLNSDYIDKVRKPLMRFDAFPSEVHSSVDSSGVKVRCLAGDLSQLTAPGKCPAFPQDLALTFGLHQSAINNTAATMLSSRSIPLTLLMQQQFSLTPPGDTAEEDPLYITFNKNSPLNVAFEDGTITIAYSGASYRFKGRRYSGMDILLRFRPQRVEETYELVQVGEPQVVLPKTKNGARPKLGIRDYALRRILSNLLKRETPSRVSLPCDTPWPTINESNAAVSFIDIQDGWLRLGVSINTKVSEEPDRVR